MAHEGTNWIIVSSRNNWAVYRASGRLLRHNNGVWLRDAIIAERRFVVDVIII